MKRWITDPDTFNACHFDWNKYVEGTEALSHVPEGPIITTDPNFVRMDTCSRVQVEGDSTQTTYLVFGGELHRIPEDAIDRLFNNRDGVRKYHRLYLPIGMPLTDAQLIHPAGTGSYYLYANGVKYHIANPPTFEACNFDWNKVTEKPAEASKILTGNPIKKD